MIAIFACSLLVNFWPWIQPALSLFQRLSVGELSQQLPFLLIDEMAFFSLSALWKSPLQYCLPPSLCTIKPGSGLRLTQAISSAFLTSLVSMCAARLQPTICLLCKSSITAKYSQPCAVWMYAMSVVQTRSGADAVKRLWTKSAATGNL